MSKTARTLHVAIQAWRRALETRRTLESFCRCNAGQPFQLWYGLDHGFDPDVQEVLESFGAERAVVCPWQHGISGVAGLLVGAVAEHMERGDGLLYLQNDWESTRGLPWGLLWRVIEDRAFACLRLFGRYKERGPDGELRRPVDMRERPRGSPTKDHQQWLPETICGERVLVADDLFLNHLPTVARADVFASAMQGATFERATISRGVRGRVVWLADDPVFYHVGYKTTKGRPYGGREMLRPAPPDYDPDATSRAEGVRPGLRRITRREPAHLSCPWPHPGRSRSLIAVGRARYVGRDGRLKQAVVRRSGGRRNGRRFVVWVPVKRRRTIHVAVLGWRRSREMARTLASLWEMNPDAPLRLHYGLDAAYDPNVRSICERYKAERAFISEKHIGIAAMTERLLQVVAAKCKPGDALLHLQEDWISLRPLPLELLWWAAERKDVEFLRLFGQKKELRRGRWRKPVTQHKRAKSGAPTGAREKWTARTVCGEPLLIGQSYWCHPPIVGAPDVFVEATAGARTERLSMGRRWGRPVAWCVDPVFAHIGYTRSAHSLGGRTGAERAKRPGDPPSLKLLRLAAKDGPACHLAAVSLPALPRCQSCLYIGANLRRFELRRALGHCAVTVLEVWPPYCEALRKAPALGLTRIIEGDVRDPKALAEAAEDGPYDLVCWWHGPEHLPKHEAIELLRLPDGPLSRLASKAMLIGVPYGQMRQPPVDGNPHQEHVSTWLPEDLAALGYETASTGRCNRNGLTVAWWTAPSEAAKWEDSSDDTQAVGMADAKPAGRPGTTRRAAVARRARAAGRGYRKRRYRPGGPADHRAPQVKRRHAAAAHEPTGQASQASLHAAGLGEGS